MDYKCLNLENATFKCTIKYFYKECSKRIERKLHDQNKTQYEVYPDDPSLFSHVINCKCGKNNPYLIPPILIDGIGNSKDKIEETYGLIPILGFERHEIFWGNDDEFDSNLFTIFYCIIYDLLNCSSKYDLDIDYILCDYARYARYSRYKQLSSYDADFLLEYYGVIKDDIDYNIDSALRTAILFLFLKPNINVNFRKTFYEFTRKTLSFKKIDKIIEDKYIRSIFIPLLKQNIPSEDSLGIRVKAIIETDLLNSKDLLLAYKHGIKLPFADLQRKLNNASSSYVTKLEEIQEEYLGFPAPLNSVN